MEELHIKSVSLKGVRRFLGVLVILAAFAWLAGHLKEIRFFDVLYFITFLVLGLVNLTDGFGQEKTWVRNENGFLKIKWFNKFRPIEISNAEIESISLARLEILIRKKAGKPVKLSLDSFETAQKKEIYEFFIAYCTSAGIELKRSFDRLTVEG